MTIREMIAKLIECEDIDMDIPIFNIINRKIYVEMNHANPQ